MHRIVEDGLEDYLAGRVLRDFEVHVENCGECRGELEEIGFVSSLFRESFEAPAVEVVPSPGFYARLSESIEARKPVSPWAFFSIDAIFGRRVAFRLAAGVGFSRWFPGFARIRCDSGLAAAGTGGDYRSTRSGFGGHSGKSGPNDGHACQLRAVRLNVDHRNLPRNAEKASCGSLVAFVVDFCLRVRRRCAGDELVPSQNYSG